MRSKNIRKLSLPLVILCGGLGTRLESVSKGIPKILMPIGNKSFLEIQIEKYHQEGIEEFIYILGHNNALVEKEINKIKKANSKLKIDILYEGPNRLGTGGAIKKFINDLPKYFLLTYGDNYLNINIQSLIEKFILGDYSKNILSIFKNKNWLEPSNIIFNEKNSHIVKYSKNYNDAMEYIDYGMSLWKSDFIKSVDVEDGVFDLSIIINAALKNKMLDPFIAEDRFYEIGTPSSYEEFKFFYLNHV